MVSFPPERFEHCLLTGKGLSCVRTHRVVFQDLNFEIGSGEVLVVTGNNGSGKTSLLRIVAGLGRARSGRLEWNRQLLELEQHRVRVGWLGHQNALHPQLTPRETLDFWLRWHGCTTTSSHPALSGALLRRAGLLSAADLPTRLLSAGQQRKLALARLLTTMRSVWLLDEPAVSLDQSGLAFLSELVDQHISQAGLVVVSDHGSWQPGEFQRLSLGTP